MDIFALYRQAATNADGRIHYARTVAPTSEPLTLDDAVRHLQLAVTDDTGYVTSLIQVARDVAENATGQALITSTWRGVCETWPRSGRISLAVAPVTAVTSVKYYAEGETALTTVSAANYTVSTTVSPAVITFNDTFTSPALANRPDAVQVTFTAGYASAAAVPPSIKHALRILVRHYYDHPEQIATGAFTELPFNLRHLLESNRVSGWVA
jgi:uncharacterized phiE125 gp8 family phage protein